MAGARTMDNCAPRHIKLVTARSFKKNFSSTIKIKWGHQTMALVTSVGQLGHVAWYVQFIDVYFTQNTQLLSDLFNLRRTIISLNRRTLPIQFLRACAHSLGSVQGPPICNRGICQWTESKPLRDQTVQNQSRCFSPITRISSYGDLRAKWDLRNVVFEQWPQNRCLLAGFLDDANAKLSKTWSPLKLLSSKAVRTQPARTPTVSMSFLRLPFVYFVLLHDFILS